MKHFISVVFYIISLPLVAQQIEFYPYSNYTRRVISNPNIIVMSIDSAYNKNGKLIRVERKDYNEKGNLVQANINNKYFRIFGYFKDSILSSNIWLTKKDTSYVWFDEYNELGKHIKSVYGKGFNKPISISLRKYDIDNRLIKIEYRNKNNKLTKYSEIIYNDSGTTAEYRGFNSKGKLVSIYSFACDAKGEAIKSVKKTNYCTTKNKLDNGNFYEIEETTKGAKIYKRIYTYSPDTLLLNYEYINDKGRSVTKVNYSYNADKLLQQVQVYKNNKFSFSNVYSHNTQGLKTEFLFLNTKGLLISKTTTHYVFRD